MAQIMTTKETAKYLKLHEITVCKYATEGKIPAIRIGKVWRFDKEVIDEWISRDLQSVVKSLKALTQKTEKIEKKLDRLEKAKPVKKPKARARVKAKPAKKRVTRKVTVKKRIKVTASDIVMSIIKGSRKGVNTATLQKKTGFNNQKIRNNIFNLTKQDKIKRARRGVYIAK